MSMFKQLQAQRATLHFRRIELKYLLPDRYVPAFMESIAPYVQPDPFLVSEGLGRTSYPVTSLYFDSADLQSLAEKEAGLLSRRKMRLRTYDKAFHSSSLAFLEIKRRHDFVVSKDRLFLPAGALADLPPMSQLLRTLLHRAQDGEVLAEMEVLHRWLNLQPTALVRYSRTPFIGMQDRRFRVTVDRNLAGAWRPFSVVGSQMLRPCHPGMSIIEMKCNHAVPAWFHDAIWEWDLWRVSHSKYALTVQSLREEWEPSLFASS